MARTASLPGFRPGQGAGRPAEEAVRPGAARRGAGAGGQPGHRQGDRRSRPEACHAAQGRAQERVRRGQGRRVRGRARGAAGDRPARFLGRRARAAEGDRAGQERRRGAGAHRQGEPRAEAGRPAAPGAEGRRDQARLRGLGRRRRVSRRQGRGLHARARLGLVHPGLRGPADRRRARQADRRQGDVPGRLRQRRARRQGSGLQVHGQGDPRVRRPADRRCAGEEEQLREPRGDEEGRLRAHRPGVHADLARHDQAPAARQARRHLQVPGAGRPGRGRVRRDLAAHRGSQEERREARGRRRRPRSTARSPSAACGSAFCWPMSAAPTTST